jgi:subtilisin family serine protease
MKIRWIALASLMLASGCSDVADVPEAEGVAINRAALSASKDDPRTESLGERYIVQFNDFARGTEALHAARGFVARALPSHGAVAAYLSEASVRSLRQNRFVTRIELDAPRYPLGQTVPYGIPMVQADQLVDTSDVDPSGAVTVCIIDSGFYGAHEDHVGNTNVTYTSDLGTGASNVDGCGHGTHVAGTIAGVANDMGVVGVNGAGRIKLKIVKVFGNDCAWAYSSSLVAALDQCRAGVTGKLVVSMSLGGGTKSVTEENAFNAAEAAGVLSIAAAGNDGNTKMSYPASYSSVMSVAAVDENKALASFSQRNAQVEIAAPGVGILSTVPWKAEASVAVGAITADGSGIEGAATTNGVSGALVSGGLCTTTVSYTGKVVLCQRGTNSFADKVSRARSGGAVAVVIYNNVDGAFTATLGTGVTSPLPAISISKADGEALLGAVGQSATLVNKITVPGSGYEAWDGTSMATPHVSGVAALVWNNVRTATARQVRAALDNTAQDLGAAGRDSNFGYGLVRAKAAYDALVASTPSCTPSAMSCTDGKDNDCDGSVDSGPECPVSGCTLAPLGGACTRNADCCSNKCTGKAGKMTCK